MVEISDFRRFVAPWRRSRGSFGLLGVPVLVATSVIIASSSSAQPSLPDDVAPDIDLYALISGKCTKLKVDGRDFTCKTVAYFHSETGRADFTVPLEDPADNTHVISFSGENGQRTEQNLYSLNVDRMLVKSKDRPKADGLPVPAVQVSSGACKELGNFAAGQVSSVACSATDQSGRTYQLQFESDGSPITIRRVRQSAPSIKQDPFR